MTDFKKYVDQLEKLIETINNECIGIDNEKNKFKENQIIKNLRKKYNSTLDELFERIWSCSNSDADLYLENCKYMMERLDKYFMDKVETVTYIRKRPLGYAGDFVTMNYIYDYNGESYFGNNTFAKYFNNYICTIKVSNSNIGRKRIIKEKILETIDNTEGETKILSLGSGPAREIIELINENKIKKGATFYCLDFEEKAIEFVKNKIALMRFDKSLVKIVFLHENLLTIIKKDKFVLPEHSVDFLYISGVFDYFKAKICKKMLTNMLPIVKEQKSLKLLFFNMSQEDQASRAWYETYGRWEMIHRKAEELKDWEADLDGYRLDIIRINDCPSYHMVEIK